jgi:Zn-dependent peptidase ImmA (M78 family)
MVDARLHKWTNDSVRLFAGGKDPIAVMTEMASAVALDAQQEGWSGPPFDPFALAEFLKIPIAPNSDIPDARALPAGAGKIRIEYNPNRPKARTRYSVAHEIAHTFFPNASQTVRNRVARGDYEKDEWELEMLCNIGAAELLMPTGSLTGVQNKPITIKEILELRRQFEVSTESVLLRFIRVTNEPYILFAASRENSAQSRYKIDYSITSRTSDQKLLADFLLPKETIVGACTAIGYVATADEKWPVLGPVHVECVGLSPYPQTVYPRVAGLLRVAASDAKHAGSIQFVTGDATKPRLTGPRIIAHVVNDATPNWGAGFGKVVQQKWPDVQGAFREAWIKKGRLHLGDIYFCSPESDITVCQLVCQRGYGPSERVRLRYSALKECLKLLRDKCIAENATIHMPRIGSGEAGGSWALVSALIDEVLCAAGLSVTVYDLPIKQKLRSVQHGLFDSVT